MESTVTLKTLDSSIVSLIILVIVLLNSYNRFDRLFPERRLFFYIVIFNMFMLVIDYLGWAFNGIEGAAALNAAFNCLLYAAAPAAPMLWFLYVNYQIFHDEARLRGAMPALVSLLAVNTVLSALSLFTGWFFSIDSNNVYSRGPLFFVYVIFNILLIAYSAILAFKNRSVLQKKYFYSMMLFFVPPVIGILLQTFYYGVSYNWVGMTVSVIIVYLNMQNRNLNIDYLTGAYNRRWLEFYKGSILKNGFTETRFSAIMLDLDNLKPINDELGHDAGDEALKDTVDLLKRSIRSGDFVARIGGDEFVVILDVQETSALGAVKKRIEREVAEFNKAGKTPYKLSLSYGCRVYDAKTGEKLEDFFKDIDSLMYKNKNEKKAKQEE